jgi:hypothetical protein
MPFITLKDESGGAQDIIWPGRFVEGKRRTFISVSVACVVDVTMSPCPRWRRVA